jgi:uncharacterized repeat protein (TIGR04138 family)
MANGDLVDWIDRLRERDPRYRREAYLFVLSALSDAVGRLPKPRHVTGQEVLKGVVSLARDQFGPLAHTVLVEWGVTSSRDIGEIVFHLVDAGLLSRQPTDRLEDFENGINLRRELEPEGSR